MQERETEGIDRETEERERERKRDERGCAGVTFDRRGPGGAGGGGS